MKNRHTLYIFIITSLMFVESRGFSQVSSSNIDYLIPKNVHDTVSKYISLDGKLANNYLCLLESSADTSSLLFIQFDGRSKELMEVYLKSNRVVTIDGIIIPILFYSDIEFSSIFNGESDEGKISSTFIAFGGFRITFIGNFNYAKILSYGLDL